MSDDLSKLNLVELYDALIPLETPPAIAMTPQTVGWVWLGVSVLALLIWTMYRYQKHRQRTAYRRRALSVIEANGNEPAELARILRHTALQAYSRADVAPLAGEDWLRFLDSCAKDSSFLGSPEGDALLAAAYRPGVSAPALKAKIEHWIKTHVSDQRLP